MVTFYKNDIKDAAEDIKRELPSDGLRLLKPSMCKRKYYLIPKDVDLVQGNTTIVSLLKKNTVYMEFRKQEKDRERSS